MKLSCPAVGRAPIRMKIGDFQVENRIQITTAILIFLITGGLVSQLKAQDDLSPKILLITMDSLRPDHLGCYGYKKNTSPNIDKLAKEGVVFTQAIAQASWTLPSMVSIITSSYPSTHKVYNWDMGFSPKLLTLARILKGCGYYNFFCSGHNKTLSAILGSQGGFDKWSSNEDLIASSKVNGYALKFLKENYQRKFFLWIHYMDTHNHFYKIGNDEESSLSRSEKAASIYKYDAAITQVDRQIGVIIDELKKLNIDKNTLIIITADHGEEMCEHGICFNHGGFLWDPIIRVPLIMVWKNHFSGNNRKLNQVQHIDIASTICDILKIKKPISFEGQSLLPIISGSESTLRPAFSEHQERVGDSKDGAWVYTKFSVRLDNWKLIYTLYPKEKKYDLYNLKNDPEELNILTEAEGVKLESLKEELEAWLKRKKPKINPIAKSFDEETKERLKSLGYLQ